MKWTRFLGRALMAALTTMALAAAFASSASAVNPEILPDPTVKPISFTDKGPAGKLQTLGKKVVECEKNVSKGETTSPKLGKFEITFENCKSLGVKCTGLGDTTAGNITLKKGEFHFVYGLLVKTGAEVPAITILLGETIHFTCGGIVLVEVLNGGCFAGEISPINKLTKTLTATFAESGTLGDQDIIKVSETKAGTEKECKALVRTNDEGVEEDGAITQVDTLEGFKQGGVAIEALLMA